MLNWKTKTAGVLLPAVLTMFVCTPARSDDLGKPERARTRRPTPETIKLWTVLDAIGREQNFRPFFAADSLVKATQVNGIEFGVVRFFEWLANFNLFFDYDHNVVYSEKNLPPRIRP